jgi:hypothetical protein
MGPASERADLCDTISISSRIDTSTACTGPLSAEVEGAEAHQMEQQEMGGSSSCDSR